METPAIELLTTIPLRKDGTVVVDLKIGRNNFVKYVFEQDDETGAGVCKTIKEEHAKVLLERGNFLSREELLEEMELQRRIAQRNAKRTVATAATAGTFNPLAPDFDPQDHDEPVNRMAAPEEVGTVPTGRVRKAGSGKAASN